MKLPITLACCTALILGSGRLAAQANGETPRALATPSETGSDRILLPEFKAQRNARRSHLAAGAASRLSSNASLAERHNLAQIYLDAAQQELEGIEYDYVTAGILDEIIDVQMKLGDLPAALRTLGKFPDDSWKALSWGHLAGTLAQAGDIPAAQRMAGEIRNAFGKNVALRQIAAAQVRAGDLPAAVRTVESVRDDALQSSVRTGVAVAQALAGDVPAALRTAKEQGDDIEEKLTIEEIVHAQARSGDIPAARATLERLKDSHTFVGEYLLIATAEAQARAGDLPAALRTVEDISTGMFKTSALCGIAEVQAQAGDTATALSIAADVGRELWVPNMVGRIAAAQLRYGDNTGASKTLDSLDPGKATAEGYAGVAGGLLADSVKPIAK